MDWREDAVGFYFVKMKNDQSGEVSKFPRHVYANPLDPVVCPFLSLATYLLCFPETMCGLMLFPGGEQSVSSDGQYCFCIVMMLFSCENTIVSLTSPAPPCLLQSRFSKTLTKLLNLPEVKEQLKTHGLSPKDIGTHSFRKGGGTYCSSGTTASPSHAAISNRAGWKMPGVSGTYLR